MTKKSDTVDLTLHDVPLNKAMEILMLLGADAPNVTNGRTGTIEEQIAEDMQTEAEHAAELDAEEEPEVEEDEEPEVEEDEEPEEELDDDADEYTLADIRAEVQKFLKGYKTQAAGKKAFGSLLAELPTPVKNLTAVEESEYGILMAWLKGEEDPLG